MKGIDKMSILFTNKEIIDTCINEEFRHNNIQYFRHLLPNAYLYDNEILIKIDHDGLHILKSKVDQPNQWRLDSTINLLISTIVEYGLKLNFHAIINLADGCPKNEMFTRLSTVGRHKDSNHIGIPDSLCWSYLQNNKLHSLLSQYDLNFNDKYESIVFRGADTGKIRASLLNQRLEFCNRYSMDTMIDAKITQLVGYNSDFLTETKIKTSDIIAAPLSIEEQLKHKYILYIYGNSVSTDRLLWNLASNSLLIILDPLPEEYDYIWYHKFLLDTDTVPSIPEENFKEKFIKLIQDKNRVNEYNIKQKALGQILLQPDIYKLYTKEVLIKYNQLYDQK